MAKINLTFDNNEFNREASVIEFTIPDDLNIYEFKTVCIRMASAMGYTENTIKKAFGSDEYQTEEEREFKKFIKSVFHSESIFEPLTGSLHYSN